MKIKSIISKLKIEVNPGKFSLEKRKKNRTVRDTGSTGGFTITARASTAAAIDDQAFFFAIATACFVFHFRFVWKLNKKEEEKLGLLKPINSKAFSFSTF